MPIVLKSQLKDIHIFLYQVKLNSKFSLLVKVYDGVEIRRRKAGTTMFCNRSCDRSESLAAFIDPLNPSGNVWGARIWSCHSNVYRILWAGKNCIKFIVIKLSILKFTGYIKMSNFYNWVYYLLWSFLLFKKLIIYIHDTFTFNFHFLISNL